MITIHKNGKNNQDRVRSQSQVMKIRNLGLLVPSFPSMYEVLINTEFINDKASDISSTAGN